MAIPAAMAIISTASGVASGTIAAVGSTAIGANLFAGGLFAAAAGHFLVTTALGAVLSSLTPNPSSKSTPSGYTVTATGSTLDHQIIYGKTKISGARIFDGTTGDTNESLHRVLAFAGHEIHSYKEIWFNDEKLEFNDDGVVTAPARYVGVVKINQHLGSDTQLADRDLVSAVAEWTDSHRLRGIAYLYVRLEYNRDKFPNGIPEISAVVKGKKVYDPRDVDQSFDSPDTWKWSNNTALCLRDYITSKSYGLSEEETGVDDANISIAADVCDYYDYPTLTGDKRYSCDGAFTTGTEPYSILNAILSSMGGLLWYAQGKWRMKPAYWTDEVLTLDENDLRGSIAVNTRHSRRDNFNIVTGIFRGEESNWQDTDFPPVTNQSFINKDNGQELTKDLELRFTNTSEEARRIANIYLERNRQQITVQASFGLNAFACQVGDNIILNNNRFGWVNKKFEVVAWTFGLTDSQDLTINMTLREISANVFDDVSDGLIYERDNTRLSSPFDVPYIGMDITAEAQVSNQKVSNIAIIEITSPSDVYLDKVEVDYKSIFKTKWKQVGIGPLGIFEAVDLETGFYDFRARAVNVFGVRGDWEYVMGKEINAFIGDPSDVTEFDYELSGGSIFFSWEPVPDADLSHYKIRHSPLTSGAEWGESSTVINKIARPGTSASLPARAGTFFIRAYDKENNYSVNTSQVVVTQDELAPLADLKTAQEDPIFSGTDIGTVLVGSTLQILDTDVNNPYGEYEFTNIVNLATPAYARVTGYTIFGRAYNGDDYLWDDIPQKMDTWPGLMDTWTDPEIGFSDLEVKIFVSVTQDDPLASPTWSNYKIANGSFFTGRGFRFKAKLKSSNKDFTPSVSELSVTVEY